MWSRAVSEKGQVPRDSRSCQTMISMATGHSPVHLGHCLTAKPANWLVKKKQIWVPQVVPCAVGTKDLTSARSDCCQKFNIMGSLAPTPNGKLISTEGFSSYGEGRSRHRKPKSDTEPRWHLRKPFQELTGGRGGLQKSRSTE